MRRSKKTRRRLLAQQLETRQLLAATGTTADFVVPTAQAGFEDSGVIDVTDWNSDPALNANPAPGNNDHSALQAVIDQYAGTGKILYFPAGEYEIDQALVMPILASNRATAFTILQGENRDRVTIKLADSVGLDGAAIFFQVTTADAFRNAVRDLTIDVG
ncbi:MAG: glycosyl hydrolase family 28-related protein, partial [Planctomycetota bacterium]